MSTLVQQLVHVDAREQRLQVDPVHDGVDVDLVDDGLHVDLLDDGLHVDLLDDRADVDPLDHLVDVESTDDPGDHLVGNGLDDLGRPADQGVQETPSPPAAAALGRHVVVSPGEVAGRWPS